MLLHTKIVFIITILCLSTIISSTNATELSNTDYIQLVPPSFQGDATDLESWNCTIKTYGGVVPFQKLVDNLSSGKTNFGSIYGKDFNSSQIKDIFLTVEDLKLISSKYDGNTNIEIINSNITKNGRFLFIFMNLSNREESTGGTIDHSTVIVRKNTETKKVRIIAKDKLGDFNYKTRIWEGGLWLCGYITSPNGKYVAYQFELPDRFPAYAVYLKDIATGEIKEASTNILGERANVDMHELLAVSNDGRFVMFQTLSNNLTLGDINNDLDTFSKDLKTGEVVRVTSGYFYNKGELWEPYKGEYLNIWHDSWYGNPDLIPPIEPIQIEGGRTVAITPDGRYALFYAVFWKKNVYKLDGEVEHTVYLWQNPPLFRKDIMTGEISFVFMEGSEYRFWNFNGSIVNTISDDGRYVIFSSASSTLVPDDTNNLTDLFRKDMLTGEILRLNVNANGEQVTETNTAGSSLDTGNTDNDSSLISFRSNAKGLVSKIRKSQNIYLVNMRKYPLPSNAELLESLLPKIEDDHSLPTLKIFKKYQNRPVLNKRMVYLLTEVRDMESGISRLLLSNDRKTWIQKPASALINWKVTKGDGIKTIFAKAIDRNSNFRIRSINVNWDKTSPRIKLKAPTNNSNVKGKLVFKITSYDPMVSGVTSGIRYIRLFRDNLLKRDTKKSFLRYEFDTTKLSNGYHIFRIKVRDKVGNNREIKRRYFVNN